MTEQGANGGKGVGYTDNLTGSFGPADSELEGPDGCVTGAVAPYDCVMIMPIIAKGERGMTWKGA